MSERKKKPTSPKPWRRCVKLRQARKARTRKSWSAARWQRHDDEREARRGQRGILRTLKMQRLRALWRREDSARRSARMVAYHARRRAEAHD